MREQEGRVAKETARGAVLRLQAEVEAARRDADQAIIQSLAAEVENLRRRPLPPAVVELEDLPVSRGFFLVPTISGRNQLFELTREDLQQLELHKRTPYAAHDPL
jgi:hypothetical protein